MISLSERLLEIYLSEKDGWMNNIPFRLVPLEIVQGFRGAPFSVDEFYASDEWKMPNHWNAAYVKDREIVIFMYGNVNRLEKYLYAERIGSIKNIQSSGPGVWELAINEGDRIAKEKGLKGVWTVTRRLGEVKRFKQAIAGTGAIVDPKGLHIIIKTFQGENK